MAGVSAADRQKPFDLPVADSPSGLIRERARRAGVGLDDAAPSACGRSAHIAYFALTGPLPKFYRLLRTSRLPSR